MSASRWSIHRPDELDRAVELMRGSAGAELGVDRHTRRITVPALAGAQHLVEVVRDLGDADIAIDDIGLRRPTLDDVFLALTGHAAEDDLDHAADADDESSTVGQARGSAA